MIEEKTVWQVGTNTFYSLEDAKKHVNTEALTDLFAECETVHTGLDYDILLEKADELYLLLGNYLGTNG